MSKVRIYELAKETGLSNRDVIRRLAEFGVDAKSHSSTVEDDDAARFRESLGRMRAARKRVEEEREQREAEAYDLDALKTPPTQTTARRILPPHLRKAIEAQQQARPAVQGQAPAETMPPRIRPAASSPFRPDASSEVSVDPETPETLPGRQARPHIAEAHPQARADELAQQETDLAFDVQAFAPGEPPQPLSAAEAAKAGLVRAAPRSPVQQPQQPPAGHQRSAPRRSGEPGGRGGRGGRTSEPGSRGAGGEPARPEVRGIPGVPRPGTPPRPGQPTVPQRAARPLSSAATGAPVEPRRRLEHDLPKEGSGRRSIPPPIRPAPKQQPAAPAAQQRRGAMQAPDPGAPARPRPGGGPASPTQQPGTTPGAAPSRPGARKARRDRRRKDPTLQEQFEASAQPRRRSSGPVKAIVSGPVEVVAGVTVGEFAKAIGVNPTDIVRVLFGMGEMLTVTQSMSQDLIELVAAEMDADVRFVTPEQLEFGVEEDDTPGDLLPRAPVVAVMGHVDHGKTLLLDAIRSSDVASGEAGGITQHIGAYQVMHDGRAITFIDTPGHEAFTQMRARGAEVTDVAILVVAADDGVKPQTVEAINHIRAAEVPIIVAVNKMDKEGADPIRVRTQLTEHGLVAEELGGQTTMVNVSAKQRTNLDELLEMVLLQADVMDLCANPNRRARGAVIEAHLDRGRGAVATVLVQVGTLRIGDNLVAGSADCKVRAMFDDDGDPVKEAGPSMPVEVLGWNEVPDAGDKFRVVEDERTARDIAANRQARQRRMELAERRTLSLEDLSGVIAEGKVATLNLIIKGDVAGSVEAVADAMNKLELPEVKIRIVHKAVGAVTESDVSLAETSEAIIIAFNVRPDANARQAVEDSGVDLRQYSIIYKAVEDIENAVSGMLAPEFEEVTTGRAQVREVFRVPRVGVVFGCYVTEGDIRRHATVRVIRDGVVIADDRVGSLRRFKDDVTEVSSGFECGVGLERFQDVKVGDEFEIYEERELARV
ncbi:MAG: translation initiation factor IF-2 [Egibacteraceae bacterium]